MKIYIPTRGRVDTQITLASIPKPWLADTILVCPTDEASAHHKRGRKAVGCPMMGIGATRQWIIDKMAPFFKDDKVLMLDDDLVFYHRGPPRDPKSKTEFGLYANDDRQSCLMFEAVGNMLNDYAHGAISAREGCQNLDPNEECVRMLRALAYRASVITRLKISFTDMELMEDFHVALSLHEKGYPSCSLTDWAQNQNRLSGAPGGCSLYRTGELQSKSAHALAAKHQPFVTIVTKTNVQGWRDLGHERTDCTIYWKKAFKAGVSRYGRRRPGLTIRRQPQG